MTDFTIYYDTGKTTLVNAADKLANPDASGYGADQIAEKYNDNKRKHVRDVMYDHAMYGSET